MLQLLRRVRLLKLEGDPVLQDSLALLQSKMRHITGVQHQEEAIIRLLEEKNVSKLSDLLSGRGEGRLVIAAPTAAVMREWFEVLKDVCSVPVTLPGKGKPSSAIEEGNFYTEGNLETVIAVKNNTVIKTGSLEKAARGNEGALRNWRLRYFVLQGNDLTYFTKLGGEKKGVQYITLY